MSNYLKITTPQGIARFVHLNEPDEFKGKRMYKCDLILTEAEANALNTQVAEFYSNEIAAAKKGGSDIEMPCRLKPDKDGNNMWVLTGKTKNRPVVMDSTGSNPVSESVNIGGGSTIRMSLGFGTYEHKDRAGAVLYISAYINAVQLINLQEGGNESFEAVENGFVDNTAAVNGDFA